jgi:hypothetical protein
VYLWPSQYAFICSRATCTVMFDTATSDGAVAEFSEREFKMSCSCRCRQAGCLELAPQTRPVTAPMYWAVPTRACQSRVRTLVAPQRTSAWLPCLRKARFSGCLDLLRLQEHGDHHSCTHPENKFTCPSPPMLRQQVHRVDTTRTSSRGSSILQQRPLGDGRAVWYEVTADTFAKDQLCLAQPQERVRPAAEAGRKPGTSSPPTYMSCASQNQGSRDHKNGLQHSQHQDATNRVCQRVKLARSHYMA